MELREVLQKGGYATLGILFGLNLVESSRRSRWRSSAQRCSVRWGLSDAVLSLMAGLSAVTVVLAAIPLGLLADRRAADQDSAGSPRCCGRVPRCSPGWSRRCGSSPSPEWPSAWARATTRSPPRVLSDQYPVAGRTRVFAIHSRPILRQHLVAPLLAGGIAQVAGWRTAFVVLSIPCVVLALSWPSASRTPSAAPTSGSPWWTTRATGCPSIEADPVPAFAAFDRLRKIRTFNAIMISSGALGLGFAGVPAIFNLLLEQEYGLGSLGRGAVGAVTALAGLLGLLFGAGSPTACSARTRHGCLRLAGRS